MLDPWPQLALVLSGEMGHRRASGQKRRCEDVDLTGGVASSPAKFHSVAHERGTALSEEALGGWCETQTFVGAYQHTDMEERREALEQPCRATERAVAADRGSRPAPET